MLRLICRRLRDGWFWTPTSSIAEPFSRLEHVHFLREKPNFYTLWGILITPVPDQVIKQPRQSVNRAQHRRANQVGLQHTKSCLDLISTCTLWKENSNRKIQFKKTCTWLCVLVLCTLWSANISIRLSKVHILWLWVVSYCKLID